MLRDPSQSIFFAVEMLGDPSQTVFSLWKYSATPRRRVSVYENVGKDERFLRFRTNKRPF